MRDIKFRCWDVENKKWLRDGLVYEQLENQTIWNPEVAEYFSLMQFTGLQDKNGKDIYEGDIVEAQDGNRFEVGIIEYRLDRFKIIWPVSCSHTPSIPNNSTIIEIIGNVWENPELIPTNPPAG